MQPTDQFAQQRLAARQAGYSDDEINSYISQRFAPKPVAQEKPKGAGRAGGAKGFLLDITPFGRVAEKVVNPNAGKITGGELLTETALTALPFGLGRAAKVLAKGGRGLSGAIRKTEKMPQTTEAVMQAKKPLTERVAQSLTEKGSGLNVEKRLGGSQDLEKAVGTLQRLGVAGKPRKQLDIMESKMGDLSKQVDGILEKSPVPLSGQTVRQQIQQAVDDPLKYPDIDLSLPGVKKNLDSHLAKYELATSAKEVNDYIKKLNPIAIRARDKLERGVALTDKEAAALAAKRAGDEVLSELPEIKPIKQDMAILFERFPEIAKMAEKKGKFQFFGTTLPSPTQLTAGIQSTAGQVLSSKGFRPFIGTTKVAAPQAGVRIAADQTGVRGTPEETPELGAQTEVTAPSFMTPFVGSAQPPTVQEPQPRSLFSDPALLEAAYAEAIMRGDSQTASALVKGLELFGQSGGGKMAADQRKAITAATNAENVINEIEEAYNTVGGAQGAVTGQVRNIAGKVRIDQNARYYNDTRQAFLSRIARAFGEVGTLAEGDIQRAINAIPDIADTPENAQRKLATLRGLLAKAKANAASGGTTFGEETTENL